MMTDQPTLVAAAAGLPQEAAQSATQPATQQAAQEGAAGAADGKGDWLSFVQNLDAIEWIDWTAIVLLFVFFLLGLFKGFVWQVSRILTLVGAWFLAGRYGPDGEVWLHEMFDAGTTDPNLFLFLSYVVIFIAAVVLFSLLAWLVQKFVKDSGLTVYDRLGGAVLGLGTGGLGVVVILAGLYMFIPGEYGIVKAAQRSHSMSYSQKALSVLGETVPKPMRVVFGLEREDEKKPDTPPKEGADGDGREERREKDGGKDGGK